MTLINGKAYDWSSVDISLLGLDLEPTEISYDDEFEKELINGKKGRIRGYGTGNAKNTVKLTMLREDYNALCKHIKSKRKAFYTFTIPKIVVSYADEGAETVTDVLTNVTFSKRSFKAASGDKSMSVSLEGFAAGGIKSNGLDAY